MPPKNLYNQQRVGIFVDVQNLYYSAKHLYKSKVNYQEILRRSVDGRTLIRAFAYVVRAHMKDEESFIDAVKKVGFEIKSKDLQVFYGGMKKGDWDVGITVDAIELASKLDVIVLASGDGDYVPMVQYLHHAMGCKIEVLSFGKSTSSILKEAADVFIDLDKNPRRFLIRK